MAKGRAREADEVDSREDTNLENVMFEIRQLEKEMHKAFAEQRQG